MPGPTPHRTPLRRVSQGSLFALSRSGAHPDAPHGLGFLEPALAELADEADALRANVDGLRALSASLDTFNEAFASWMYVMNMNALTVDWPEVREIGCNLLEIYQLCSHRRQRTRRSSFGSGGQVRPLLDVDMSRLFVAEWRYLTKRKTRAPRSMPPPRFRRRRKRSLPRSWTKRRMRPLWSIPRRSRMGLSRQSRLNLLSQR
jgi:hypothetical protein